MPKRRRTEEPIAEGSARSTTPKRSEKVWFDDGNIVIQAGSLQFKVHKGVLVKQSTVFADLFQMPHPVNEPTLDGCPIVEMHDSAEDMEHALLAVYGDPDHLGATAKPDLPALIGMLRLGKKYELVHVRDEGLARLKREFPTSLEEYSKILGSAESPSFLLRPGSEGRLAQLFNIINLAHECSIQSILPALYLRVIGHNLEELLSHPSLFSLPHSAIRSILRGRERFLLIRKEALAGLGASDDCLSRSFCPLFSQTILTRMWMEGPDPLAIFLPQYAREELQRVRKSDSDGTQTILCEECTKDGQESHAASRRTTWMQLPEHFNLPAWDELKDFEV
ncbi:hypothetical protein NMY22_g5182 [Coprinellus aureogranulatus]|nr:hypothetical protein NMY22_g5182 [Coprinellus aureogranulatus]